MQKLQIQVIIVKPQTKIEHVKVTKRPNLKSPLTIPKITAPESLQPRPIHLAHLLISKPLNKSLTIPNKNRYPHNSKIAYNIYDIPTYDKF